MKTITKTLWIFILVSIITSCKKEDFKERDDQLIREYLEAKNLTATKTASGLYYIIENPGVPPKPTSHSFITAHYKGYLLNEKVFDNTEGREPAEFSLGSVIEGWREGMQLFGEGGKGKLFIPSHLAYGSMIKPDIPANSVLIFDIYLIKVE